MYSTKYQDILDRVANFDASEYARSRNFLDGTVSRLSPYISRGVISTKYVLEQLDTRYDRSSIEKFIQELAWRDYWQVCWNELGDAISSDLRYPQTPVSSLKPPLSLIEGNTGINDVDHAIVELYNTGYMHNHMRMYVASLATNFGLRHWLLSARWMYYHLLDGDWARNALSWQWVAGSNSHKKYWFNQENLNKYGLSEQHKTFIDQPYNNFPLYDVPSALVDDISLRLHTELPETTDIIIDSSKPTVVYTTYNLDSRWLTDLDVNRVLLLEPSHFDKYPVSPHVLKFILDLTHEIEGIQVAVMEFKQLKELCSPNFDIHYKQHPLSNHFEGIEHSRDWMTSVHTYSKSFSGWWKKARRELGL